MHTLLGTMNQPGSVLDMSKWGPDLVCHFGQILDPVHMVLGEDPGPNGVMALDTRGDGIGCQTSYRMVLSPEHVLSVIHQGR